MTDARFAQLWAESTPIIKKVCYKYASTPEDLEDILQETCLRAYKARDTFLESGKFTNWATQIGKNVGLDRRRTLKRKIDAAQLPTFGTDGLKDEIDFADPDALNAIDQYVTKNIIWDDLKARLLPSDFELLYYRLHIQESYPELATRLSVPIGTIRSRLHRILKRLRHLNAAH